MGNDQLSLFGFDFAAPNGDHSVSVEVELQPDVGRAVIAVRELSAMVCACGNAEMDGKRCRFGATHEVPWRS
jgi:hypothetical protein